jgi:hypothetical protein
MTMETWMTDLPWPVHLADGYATDAALAHATAVGLFEVIDRFRFADPANPIPAPGTADLPDEVHRHALDAIHAAATVQILSGHDDLDPDALDDAVARAEMGSITARRGVRRLAQIGLGVAQHSHDGDEVELLERTMVGVLADEGSAVAAVDDFPLVGRTRDEISVELAGLVARLICEQPLADADDRLGFVLAAPAIQPIVVAITSGGSVEVDDAHFAAPVTITEVTASIIERVTAIDPAAIGRLTLGWELP